MPTRTANTAPTANDQGVRDVRAYLLDMVEQLAKLAEKSGERSMAIHLLAIRDAARTTRARLKG